MRRKITAIIALVLVFVFSLTACQATDVVGKTAGTSFEAVLAKIKSNVSYDQNSSSWVLTSPAGDEFKWSKDFSSTNSDAVVTFDAAPFIKAGLDTSKLPADKYTYDAAASRIVMSYELGQDKFSYSKDASAIDSFKNTIKAKRDLIGYHQELDHYGIALGDGNMFEWAKDMSKNEKDIVFVLNPQPFIDAGTDPAKVEGWIFAKVNVMDKDGKKVQVDKILRPFDLK